VCILHTLISVMLDWELADKSEVTVDGSQTHDWVVVESYCTLRLLVIRTAISNHVSTTHTDTAWHSECFKLSCNGRDHVVVIAMDLKGCGLDVWPFQWSRLLLHAICLFSPNQQHWSTDPREIHPLMSSFLNPPISERSGYRPLFKLAPNTST